MGKFGKLIVISISVLIALALLLNVDCVRYKYLNTTNPGIVVKVDRINGKIHAMRINIEDETIWTK